LHVRELGVGVCSALLCPALVGWHVKT